MVEERLRDAADKYLRAAEVVAVLRKEASEAASRSS